MPSSKKKILAQTCSRGCYHRALQQQTGGETDAIRGELDGVPFYLYGMKEPDYIMQIMSTYGTLHEKGPEKKGTLP